MPAAGVDAYAIVVNHVWLHCIKPDKGLLGKLEVVLLYG